MRPGLIYTLVFVKSDTDILLGFKKRGLGIHKWNGFGGKVEKNETILEGAIRETKEESNLNVYHLKHIGIITYENLKCNIIHVVHVFTTNKFSDIVQETEEMVPKWFKTFEVPYLKMWPDQKYWYEFMLDDKYFHAHTIYDDEHIFKSCDVNLYKSFTDVLQEVNNMMETKT